MPDTITLYDMTSVHAGKAYFPNTWKTRYCLNYKGLPYKTVWVELCDVEKVSKEIGTLPTDQKLGAPYYSVPAIVDPNTKTALAESALIAEYLDATYPDTPKLFPTGTHALQLAFIDAFMAKIQPLWPFAVPVAARLLNPRSYEYFVRTREKWFGKKLEDFTPTGEDAVKEWDQLRAGFDDVDRWLQKGSVDGPFFLGQEPAFIDFVVASFVSYIKYVWGSDSSQWKDIMTWNEGRWESFIKRFEKYETTI